jgi:hypothetical protein
MKKAGGGFGFVMGLITLVIVLFLATRAWKAVMPTAAQALQPGTPGKIDDHGQKEVGDAIRSGNLPNLKQMGQSTEQHIDQIKDAAKGQD